MKKIIILYSTSGLGHYNSAKAIFQAFSRASEETEIKMMNIIDHGNTFFKFFHFKFYVSLMKYGKKIWAALYYLSDISFFDVIARAIRHFADMKSWRGLEDVLIKEDADAIVATHFFMTSIARAIKNNKRIKAKLFLMVSGFGMHNIWASKHVDHFFTSVQYVSDELVRRNIDPEKISVTGMPSPEEFSRNYDKDSLREHFGLDPAKKTIFVLGGAFGATPMEKILISLNNNNTDFQVIVVCGYNKRAFDNIKSIENSLSYDVKLYGFTDEIAQMMAVSDLMISKAGTLSVTQALNMRLPLIFFSHVPGHETPTVNLLVKNRAAKRAMALKEVPILVKKILHDEGLYGTMIENIDRIRRPNAADDIVKIILKEIDIKQKDRSE